MAVAWMAWMRTRKHIRISLSTQRGSPSLIFLNDFRVVVDWREARTSFKKGNDAKK